MSHDYHSLLLRQLKRLGIDVDAGTPNAEQWRHFLERVSRAYGEADEGRYLLERSQRISSRETQELYQRLQEAQRVAGFGNWSWDRRENRDLWSEECSRIVGLDANAPVPGYRQLVKRIHRHDRAALKQALRAALQHGRHIELEYRVCLAGGKTRWVSMLGQSVKNEQGEVLRVFGTVVDITRRKQVELRQFIEHSVTRLLAEANSPLAVMPRIIQTLCETLAWDCGAFWMLNRQEGRFQRMVTWAAPRSRAANFFQISSDRANAGSCTGLIARTAQSGAPVWIADVASDENFRKRKAAAVESGLHAAFAFPIQQASGDVVGVLEFFHQQAQDADAEILQSAHSIGRQIAQFFQRKQAEDGLRQSETHFRALVEQASDSFYMHDMDGRIIDVNQRGCASLGYTRRELLGMNITSVDVGLSADDLRKLQPQLAARAAVALESRYRRKDDTTFPVEISLGLIEIDGQQHLLSLVRDVTDRKQMQEHIQHLAFHDSLTGLPNRAKFNGYLSHAIVQAQRYAKGLALLFIDLDRFKNINDTLGHVAGDRLLQEMARRLAACLREGDRVARIGGGEDELVARLGGDEFVVLLEELADPAYAAHVARKVLATLVKEFALEGHLIHMTASIGISTYPQDGADELSLMKNADIAMYRAKENGRNNYQFYSAQMNLHSFELLALESGLRRAIENGELMLQYQPKVNVRSGSLSGAEALVRWNHPELGMTLPEHFIPLAEENGLIVPIGNWVLREACRQNREWRTQGLPPLRVAVNLSARQFNDDNLLADIARILSETGMDPTLLEIEITESVVMYNLDKAAQSLAKLKDMGVRVAIDDFGIGYSSLLHLKRFPIDTVKIDRSFICEIPGNSVDEAITSAIIAMGKSMNITVVAEGVETEAQRRFLVERDCEEAQGYYYSEALDPKDFIRFVREHLRNQQAPTPVVQRLDGAR